MNNPNSCPFCFVSAVAVTQVGGPSKNPDAGAISICDDCLRVSIFEGGGRRRPLTASELKELIISDAWPKVCAAQKAIAIVKQKHAKQGGRSNA